MELFRLFGTIAVNNDEANSNIDETTDLAEQSESKMSAAFKKIGTAVAAAFAVDRIVAFGKSVTEAAATVAAEQSAFEQIMGDYSNTAQEKVNEIADATGMVATRLTPYMTSMTAKFKGLGYDIDDATTLASDGLNLAADAAAFWDKSLDDSMSALNSFINGSYEGGEAIGLFANDTQMAQYAIKTGLVDTTAAWSSLDEATKQATRLEYAQAMFEQSGATGQAAKEAEQYANVQANLTEKWRQFKAQIGEPILQNIVLPAMEKLSSIVDILSSGFQTLSTWVSEHQTLVTILAIAVGTLSAAIIAYNIAQNAATIATTVATAATTAFGAVMAFVTSPITLVILAIGALIAIAVSLYKNWDTVSAKAKEIWNNIKSTITNVVNGIKNTVSSVFDTVKSTVTNIFNSIKSTATSVWNGIKSAITNPIETAKNIIKSQIDKIKSFFDNLKIKFPDIKLPHFKITGKFSLNPISVPKLSIDWYKKAMDNAMLLNSPTIFGMNGAGQLMGGGEAGQEVVSGSGTLMDMIRSAVKTETAGMNEGFERLISILDAYFPEIIANSKKNIVLNNGVLVGELASDIDYTLGNINSLRGRGQ